LLFLLREKRLALNEHKQHKNKMKINKIVSDIYEEDNVIEETKNIENKLKDIVNDDIDNNDNNDNNGNNNINYDNTKVNDNDNTNNINTIIPKFRSNRPIKNNI
jgi:hypothetical protein